MTLCMLLCLPLYVACSGSEGSNLPEGEGGNTPTADGGNNGGGGGGGGGGGRGDGGTGGNAGPHRDAGGGGNGDSGTPPNNNDATSICVDKINAYRATLGLAPYARWTDKESCASGQAKSDSETNKPHGAFGQCTEMAQDECPGWSGPPESMIASCLAQMWAEGPGGGHYDNMSSKKYTKVACGFYTMPNGKVWAVQDFR